MYSVLKWLAFITVYLIFMDCIAHPMLGLGHADIIINILDFPDVASLKKRVSFPPRTKVPF